MKLCAFLLFTFAFSCATADFTLMSDANQTKQYVYVYDFNKSKKDIYEKSYQWIAETFTSAKAVIEMADKEAGIIVGHGAGVVNQPNPVYGQLPCNYLFIIKIETKDKKSRLSFLEINWAPTQFGGDRVNHPLKYKWSFDQIDTQIPALANRYKIAIEKADSF